MRNNGFWCVIRDVCVRRWDPEFKMNLWHTESHEQVTPARETMEEADEDFVNMGFKYRKTATAQCDDHFEGATWTRHIVQHCRTRY